MRRVFIPLLVSTLLFAVSGCAFDEAQGDELDEVGAAADDRDLATGDDRDLATEDDRDLATEEGSSSLEGDESADGPSTNSITYYDGCRQAHQACRCQNTGWAGFCQLQLKNWPDDFVMLCNCD